MNSHKLAINSISQQLRNHLFCAAIFSDILFLVGVVNFSPVPRGAGLYIESARPH